MEINADDMFQALSQQRNSALDENAKCYALIQTLNRQIEELNKQIQALRVEHEILPVTPTPD